MSSENDAVRCVFESLEISSRIRMRMLHKNLTEFCLFFFLNEFTEEQERVQKKTFVNWINSYLSKVSK